MHKVLSYVIFVYILKQNTKLFFTDVFWVLRIWGLV